MKILETEVESVNNALWCVMNPTPRPCFTSELLSEFEKLPDTLFYSMGLSRPIFTVFLSGHPDVFNLGGDLELFVNKVRLQDRSALYSYAYKCINALYNVHAGTVTNVSSKAHSVAVVAGECRGGGFEGALSCHYIIAEEQSRFSFPESYFNLFPGMGAYSFLSRRLNSHDALKMIGSVKQYSAGELFKMGIVDKIVEKGEGLETAADYVREKASKPETMRAVNTIHGVYGTVLKQELFDIANMWVDAAMSLREKDIRMMERIIRAQNNLNEGVNT